MSNKKNVGDTAGAPRLLASASLHDLVIERLNAVFPDEKRPVLKLLDAPCGAGAVAVRMRDMGFNVACCDIDPAHFQGKDFDLKEADLNKTLPYSDGEFDIVVSVAGLQRLTYPAVALAEFYRVLAPGGALFLGIPNYATLRRRLSFLLFGSLGKRFDQPQYDQTVLRPEANFRFPLTFNFVNHLLLETGFKNCGNYCKPTEWRRWFFLPLALLICASGAVRALNKRYASCRFSSSFALQGAKNYLIIARKPGN
jgi:SAM-dependent methyltransferase